MKGALQTDRTIEKLKRDRETISSQCKKDDHICSRSNGEVCNVYAFPNAKWRLGDCPMADESLRTKVEAIDTGKVRVGQQKQKKKNR